MTDVICELAEQDQPSYLPALQREIIEVIRKYVNVDQDAITVHFGQEGNQETLELNIVLPKDR